MGSDTVNPYEATKTEQQLRTPSLSLWVCASISLLTYMLLGCVSGCLQIASGQQIMDESKVRAIRAALPILEDDDANAQLHSDEVVWYTETELPQAYQHQAGNGVGSTTFHSPLYNISADPSDQPLGHGNGGNANVEFPWSMKPGGAHNAVGVSSVKGFHLPGPAIAFRQPMGGRIGTRNRSIVLDWVFPEGALFVELLLERIGEQDVIFEVRTRQKEGREWAVDVFRPFATADELADALEEMGPGKHRAEAIANLRATQTLPVARLVDGNHTRERSFDRTAEVYNLPLLTTSDVVTLLERPFVSCVGETFKGDAPAPSNATEYAHLVPPNYHGAFVGSDRISCMAGCHSSALRHATEFQDRGWYGRVRGNSDGILSWHPIEPASIAYNGAALPVRLRTSFVRNGWVRMLEGNSLPDGYVFTDKVDE